MGVKMEQDSNSVTFECCVLFPDTPSSERDEGDQVPAVREVVQEVLRQDQGRKVRRAGFQQSGRTEQKS